MTISAASLSQKNTLPKIQHGDSIVQLGSCFSTNMSWWLRRAGFQVTDNPLGVIFHPVPLAKQILLALGKIPLSEFVQKEDVSVSYDASSSLYGMGYSELEKLLNRQLEELKNSLETAKVLIVTFGSAHGYRLKKSGEIVANCHQQASDSFDKELTKAEAVFPLWESTIRELRKVNPSIEVIFTVSPVRYLRDGLMENSQSKAELFRLVSLLKIQAVHYFPAYELVNDVLRDYRYFEVDGVHPNNQATEFVWNFLKQELFLDKTNEIIEELMKLRKMEEHRMLYPESKKASEYQSHLKQKRESFLSQYPVVVW